MKNLFFHCFLNEILIFCLFFKTNVLIFIFRTWSPFLYGIPMTYLLSKLKCTSIIAPAWPLNVEKFSHSPYTFQSLKSTISLLKKNNYLQNFLIETSRSQIFAVGTKFCSINFTFMSCQQHYRRHKWRSTRFCRLSIGLYQSTIIESSFFWS